MPVIGFDFGSVYTKAVLLDADGNVDLSCYAKKGIDDRKLIDEFFGKVALRIPGLRFHAGAAGIEAGRSGGLLPVNAIIAMAEGVGRLHPGARSILEIGGHTSKFIVFGDDGAVSDFSTNDACAAGTGSFLEQQSRRLNIDTCELSRLSTAAARMRGGGPRQDEVVGDSRGPERGRVECCRHCATVSEYWNAPVSIQVRGEQPKFRQ